MLTNKKLCIVLELTLSDLWTKAWNKVNPCHFSHKLFVVTFELTYAFYTLHFLSAQRWFFALNGAIKDVGKRKDWTNSLQLTLKCTHEDSHEATFMPKLKNERTDLWLNKCCSFALQLENISSSGCWHLRAIVPQKKVWGVAPLETVRHPSRSQGDKLWDQHNAQCILCQVRCHCIFSGPGIRYSDIFCGPCMR